ncbi:MAG TPA: hypothetical protein VIB82_03015 [Caulobacteraceae bacterium]|jgi:hypothetical protein
MTPALPDILVGQMVALMTPLPPEAGGDYQAGRAGLVAMLAGLAAQEAERGVAVRVWENAAIRVVLGEAGADTDLAWSALDLANADLRRKLIAAHVAAEARGDEPLQREILALYQAMAKARRLDLPS